MVKIIFILFLSSSSFLLGSDVSSERGMTNLLGSDTWARCAKEMSQSNAKVYELSYERTSTMPLSPFAGEYKPKFLPGWVWLVRFLLKYICNVEIEFKGFKKYLDGKFLFVSNHQSTLETLYELSSNFPPA